MKIIFTFLGPCYFPQSILEQLDLCWPLKPHLGGIRYKVFSSAGEFCKKKSSELVFVYLFCIYHQYCTAYQQVRSPSVASKTAWLIICAEYFDLLNTRSPYLSQKHPRTHTFTNTEENIPAVTFRVEWQIKTAYIFEIIHVGHCFVFVFYSDIPHPMPPLNTRWNVRSYW